MSLNKERVLLAAQGYSELGMVDETLSELDTLPAAWQERVDVLQIRLLAYTRTRQWARGLEIGRALCHLAPNETPGYIHAAFCLHELGRTCEAKEMLLRGPRALLREATYYYNLGCYDAALGNFDGARAYLRTSFQMDKTFRDFARSDPDLQALRGLF